MKWPWQVTRHDDPEGPTLRDRILFWASENRHDSSYAKLRGIKIAVVAQVKLSFYNAILRLFMPRSGRGLSRAERRAIKQVRKLRLKQAKRKK